MKPTDTTPPALTRRAWLILTGATLTACGGGGDLMALPGTGGTGSPFYAQGSISGFGSVLLNGVRFDDTLAHITLDGQAGQATDLRLGMVAGVQGERLGVDPVSGLTLGNASAIQVWSIAQGPVTGVSASDFEVAGMRIHTDANTSLDGITGSAALQVGQAVRVWGLQAGSDGRQWTATRVALVNASTSRVTTGLVQRSNGSMLLNGWVLAGEATKSLQDGQLVRVQGAPGEPGTSQRLQVTDARVLDAGFDNRGQGPVEIEALVTALLSPNRFKIGAITVEASPGALASLSAPLRMGERVEVKGSWSSGVLLANRIEREDQETRTLEIEARIEQFVSAADFVLRGQRCDASAAKIENGSLADLKNGVKVKVEGIMAGNILKVTDLELDD